VRGMTTVAGIVYVYENIAIVLVVCDGGTLAHVGCTVRLLRGNNRPDNLGKIPCKGPLPLPSSADWGEELCCKSGPQVGQFRAVLAWMADGWECSRRKSLYSIANKRDRCTMALFSK